MKFAVAVTRLVCVGTRFSCLGDSLRRTVPCVSLFVQTRRFAERTTTTTTTMSAKRPLEDDAGAPPPLAKERRADDDAGIVADDPSSALPFPGGVGDESSSSENKRRENKHSGARKKVAFLLSYNGRDFFGMQRNPGWNTIEEEFLGAMLKAGFIDEDAFKTPQNAWFQRAARTDKGVSAVRQVVSIRMVPDDTAVEKLNALLPATIRVMGMRRVTRGFNPKTKCNARSYAYLMPTFALCPVVDGPVTESSRPTPGQRAKFDALLKRFVGTKRFHNFTARRDTECASNSRYIMDFDCGKPFEKDGMEWVLVTIKGQSFMLHQIRKMIGLCVAVLCGFASESVFDIVFRRDRVDVPIAPGLGLMLEKVHYDYYDERYGNDGMHEKLDWEAEKEKVEEFRDSVIYTSIFNAEKKEKSMLNWLATLPMHTFDVREDGAPSATSQSGVRTAIGKALVSVRLANEAAKDGAVEAVAAGDAGIASNGKDEEVPEDAAEVAAAKE